MVSLITHRNLNIFRSTIKHSFFEEENRHALITWIMILFSAVFEASHLFASTLRQAILEAFERWHNYANPWGNVLQICNPKDYLGKGWLLDNAAAADTFSRNFFAPGAPSSASSSSFSLSLFKFFASPFKIVKINQRMINKKKLGALFKDQLQ